MASRQNAFKMRAADMDRYRQALRELMAISAQNLDDERGYFYFAGIHGLPVPTWCAHGSILFFPWHRAYLYFFELALQERIGEVDIGIPWWDWLSPEAHEQGLPPAFTAPADDSNPLYRTNVDLDPRYITLIRQNPRLSATLDLTDVNQPRTIREPREPRNLPYRQPPDFVQPPSRSEDWFNVDAILQETDFNRFSMRFENIHGGVHGWVGRTMSAVPTAAFDPIFWSHHSMVDYLWYRWQQLHGRPGPDQQLWDIVLTPFPVTVQDMLDIEQLNYDYVETRVEV